MPELPEVETIKRELEKAVLGKRIASVVVYNPKVIREPAQENFIKRLQGTSIKNILRKGKLLILELSSGRSLAIHLKMTGQLIYPGSGTGSRVSFVFDDKSMLDFNDRRLFGELRVVDDWRSIEFIRKLGPEPFELKEAEFQEMLKRKKTKIKPLLLDQQFLSGVGNLYAAEALFRARIHPEREASRLSARESGLLFREIRNTLTEAIRFKGSSVDQYVQLSGDAGGYVQYHKVYGREGEPCKVCKHLVVRKSMAGRGTYFCPCCQKKS